jgi:hypothetical protein
MSQFEDYADRYKFIKMERDNGILQMTLHSKGGELLWGGRPHEELSYAFGEIARDRGNRVVLISSGDVRAPRRARLPKPGRWPPTIPCRTPTT